MYITKKDLIGFEAAYVDEFESIFGERALYNQMLKHYSDDFRFIRWLTLSLPRSTQASWDDRRRVASKYGFIADLARHCTCKLISATLESRLELLWSPELRAEFAQTCCVEMEYFDFDARLALQNTQAEHVKLACVCPSICKGSSLSRRLALIKTKEELGLFGRLCPDIDGLSYHDRLAWQHTTEEKFHVWYYWGKKANVPAPEELSWPKFTYAKRVKNSNVRALHIGEGSLQRYCNYLNLKGLESKVIERKGLPMIELSSPMLSTKLLSRGEWLVEDRLSPSGWIILPDWRFKQYYEIEEIESL